MYSKKFRDRYRHLEDKAARRMNITFYKGSTHIIATRSFINFTINDPVAKQLLKLVKTATLPEELYFNTLQYNPHLGAPGSFSGYIIIIYKI